MTKSFYIAFMFLLSVVSPSLAESLTIGDDFTVNGKIIKASCITDILYIPDHDSFKVVDCLKDEPKHSSSYARDEEILEEGSYKTEHSYQFLGKARGSFLLSSKYWGGGSGRFSSISLLKPKYENGDLYLAAEEFGYGGDRCGGGISAAEFRNGILYATINLMEADLYRELNGGIQGKEYDIFGSGFSWCAAFKNIKYDFSSGKEEIVNITLHENDFYELANEKKNDPVACMNQTIKEEMDAQFVIKPERFKPLASSINAKCASVMKVSN
ncbi:MAG: hypothetical protein EYC62_01290 [Alphaproteobacteria bacterium]|nr:MAG: hypothetical protein EYC62_01290 [Alphaproteobacteria bacterium]